jgi:hypothetical protein
MGMSGDLDAALQQERPWFVLVRPFWRTGLFKIKFKNEVRQLLKE